MAKALWIAHAGDHDPILRKLARSQDQIGWRRFMEGMSSVRFKRHIVVSGAATISFERKVGTKLLHQADEDDPWTMAGEEYLDS